MAVNVVIAYDITNNNTRARVEAMISTWGNRIQRSVYQCMLGPDDLSELLARIDAAINHHTDTVHIFTQCANCSNEAQHIGQATQPTRAPYWIL